MTTMTEKQLLKYHCGLCAAGRHDLCPGGVWNPGSGAIVTPAIGSTPAVYAGELRFCPCMVENGDRHPVTKIKCRACGHMNPLPEATDQGICTDTEGCQGRAAARQEKNPTWAMVQEVQRTAWVNGEAVERTPKQTKEVRAKAKAQRAEAKSRPCTCGCEGVTKGGAFLPGHDARHVSQLMAKWTAGDATRDEIREALAPFPALLAKLDRKLAAK